MDPEGKRIKKILEEGKGAPYYKNSIDGKRKKHLHAGLF